MVPPLTKQERASEKMVMQNGEANGIENKEQKETANDNPKQAHQFRGRSSTESIMVGSLNFKVERCTKTGILYPDEKWPLHRRKLESIIMHRHFEPLVGFVVLLNFVCVALEADVRSGAVERAPGWLRPMNLSFITFYTMEAAAKLYVERHVFFSSAWNCFDLVIVTCGLVGEIVEGAMDSVSVLRTIRLARLLRVARLFTAFTELWALIRGLLGCMRTLLWAIILMLTTTTVWSIFAVELIHPQMADLADEEVWATCGWCHSAFSSVMHANLTFFQIISGDGWSTLARPLIEKHPWTAFIFVGVIFTMTFGMLNLVTAVIVDNAAQGRQNDVKYLAAEREQQRKAMKGSLLKICQDLDQDGSGTVSLEELQTAAYELPQFMHILKVMDVSTDDLDYVFEIMDTDESGDVSYEEFADQLWKMRSQEIQTILMFMRHQVGQIWKTQKQFVVPNGSHPLKKGCEHSPRKRRPSDSGHSPRSITSNPHLKEQHQPGTIENLQSSIDDLKRLLKLHIRHESAASAQPGDSPIVGSSVVPDKIRHVKNAFGTNGAVDESGENLHRSHQLSDVNITSRLEMQLESLAKLVERLEQRSMGTSALPTGGVHNVPHIREKKWDSLRPCSSCSSDKPEVLFQPPLRGHR